MLERHQRGRMFAFAVAASAVLAAQASTYWIGDYPIEAGPAIDALIHGRWGDVITSEVLMGPVSLVLRAPFAALSLLTGGGGPVDAYENAYRFGVFPCVVVSGVVGLALAEHVVHDMRRTLARWATLVVFVVNPLSVAAIEFGHPEDILAAALVVASALLAAHKRSGWAAFVLVLAIATKQWAVLALPTIALFIDWRVARRGIALSGLFGLVVVVAVLVVDGDAVLEANKRLLDLRYAEVEPANVWWLFADPLPHSDTLRQLPGWAGLLAHPLILVVAAVVPVAARARVRAAPLTSGLAALALVFLLRAALDPVNNIYYHLPFFLLLLATDVVTGRYLPTLLAVASFVLLSDLAASPELQTAIYLAWAFAYSAYLIAWLWAPPIDAATSERASVRSLAARGPGAARTRRPS